jgi:hypothetical protein
LRKLRAKSPCAFPEALLLREKELHFSCLFIFTGIHEKSGYRDFAGGRVTLMPQQVIALPIDPERPELAPAFFIAIIAYPGSSEIEKRSLFVMALRRSYFQRLACDGTRRWKARAIEPMLLALPEDITEIALRYGMRRLRDYRMIAARMAATMMTAGSESEVRFLNTIGKRIVTHLATESEFLPPTETQKWQWGNSKPVLHLALALRNEIMTLRDEIYDDMAIEKLLDEPKWLDGAITNAEIFRDFICGSPLFRIDAADTITVAAG